MEDLLYTLEAVQDTTLETRRSESSYKPKDVSLDYEYRFRHYIPFDFVCPYCGKTSSVDTEHIIRKRGRLLNTSHSLKQRRKTTYIETTRTYETFFIRQCDDCYKKRKRQKKGLIYFCLIIVCGYILFYLYSEIINTPNFFGLIDTLERAFEKMFKQDLDWMMYAGLIGLFSYIIGNIFLKRIQRKVISIDKAFSCNAVATIKEIKEKYKNEEDNL